MKHVERWDAAEPTKVIIAPRTEFLVCIQLLGGVEEKDGPETEWCPGCASDDAESCSEIPLHAIEIINL